MRKTVLRILSAAAATLLLVPCAVAQTPPAPAPQAQPAPADPAPAATPPAQPPAQPAPAPQAQPAPAPPPAAAQAPRPAEIVRNARTMGRTSGDHEVDEVELVAVPVVFTNVRGRVEQIQDIVSAGMQELVANLQRAGLVANGLPMAVYLQLGDETFSAQLMVPVAEAPATAPSGLGVGRSPAGRAVRVMHAGPYESIDEAYDALATFVEDRNLTSREIIVERYMNDPRTTAATDLLTEIYVLVAN